MEQTSLFEAGPAVVQQRRQQKEIRSLTGLRGVAAVFVVVYHYLGYKLEFTNPLKIFVGHGYLSVDLFFVLSGFVMAMNYRHMFAARFSIASWMKFLGRRIARVYPLYLVCTLACFVVAVGTHEAITRLPMVYATLALNVAMIQGWGFAIGHSFDSAAWSLSAEWAAYLLFPMLLVPALFRGRWVGWITGVLCVAALQGLCMLPATMRYSVTQFQLLDYAAPYYGLAVVRCVAEFVLGLLAFRVAGSRWGRGMATSLWIAPAVCVATVGVMGVARADVVIVLLFFVLIVCLSAGDHLPNRILSSRIAEFFGLLSYAIYLTHMLLYHPIKWATRVGGAHGIPHAHWLAVLMIIPVSMVLNRVVEVPGRVWLRRVFEGSAPVTPLERPASLS